MAKPAKTSDAPSSSPKTPFSKHRKPSDVASSPDVSLAGSSRRGESSDVDNMSSPAARALKTSSSAHNSSPGTSATHDLSLLDDSDDEAPVRMVCSVASHLDSRKF